MLEGEFLIAFVGVGLGMVTVFPAEKLEPRRVGSYEEGMLFFSNYHHRFGLSSFRKCR